MHKKLTPEEKTAYRELAKAARRVQRLEQRRRRLKQAARDMERRSDRSEVQND